jgi:serine/threonine protein kinase
MVMQDLSGQKLGPYELRERFGRGGMAEVYKAYQTSMERFVAIKVMLAGFTDNEEFVERFRREARAVGRLRHPHIVQVFDFGVDKDVYYMAMELIRGGNLKHFIQKHQRLSGEQALTVASQLADALQYAHDAGMIHRDLKPANVMFEDESGRNAILTDFGIARILGNTGLTETGMAVGTPTYMSPEAGIGDDIDGRADIYALGVMLFEMLTGRVPYDADTPMAVVMKHVNAPLPTREIYGDMIPEEIEGIILKALAKEPNDRYQTAAEMKQAIDRVLRLGVAEVKSTPAAVPAPVTTPPQSVTDAAVHDKPTTVVNQNVAAQTPSAPASPTPTSPPPARKTPWAVLIGGIAAVILVAGIGWVAFGRQTPTDDPSGTAVAGGGTESSVGGTGSNEDGPAFSFIPNELFFPELPAELVVAPPLAENLRLTSGISPLVDEIEMMVLSGQSDAALDQLNAMLEEDPDNREARFARSLMLSASYDGEGLLPGRCPGILIESDPDDVLGYIALSDSALILPGLRRGGSVRRRSLKQAYEIGTRRTRRSYGDALASPPGRNRLSWRTMLRMPGPQAITIPYSCLATCITTRTMQHAHYRTSERCYG